MGSAIGALKIAAKKVGLTYDEYLVKIQHEKWCTKCKSWHLRTSFNVDNSRGDGLHANCHNCIRVKVKKSTKGRVSTFKGRSHTEETKRLLSEQRKGNRSPMEGRTHTLEARKKISAILRERGAKGEQCHSYKDGKLAERRDQRFSRDYKRWRFDVFSRDNFTCQECGDATGGNLNAHHKKPFADFPELRFEVSNGITLCEPCHKAHHAAN